MLKLKVTKITHQYDKYCIVKVDILKCPLDFFVDRTLDFRVKIYSNIILEGDIITTKNYSWEEYKKENRIRHYIDVLLFEKEKGEGDGYLELFLEKKIKGVGKQKIRTLMDTFKEDTEKILETKPERLKEIKKNNRRVFTDEQIEDIHTLILRNNYLEDLIIFLGYFNIKREQIEKILKEYGATALKQIKENPYGLYGLDVDFEICERISKSIGLKHNSTNRIKTLIKFYLHKKCKDLGHLYISKEDILENLNTYSRRYSFYIENITKEELILELDELIEEKEIVIEEDGSTYLSYFNYVENMIVKRLKGLLEEDKEYISSIDIEKYIYQYEKKSGFQLATRQKEAVFTSLQNGISILTGGPGTGKTQTIKAIIEISKMIKSSTLIDLCAPTGRASQRMTELTGLDASTIHKKLNYKPFLNLEEQELTPIESDFVVIDESSMIDADLFFRLISNTSERTRILFVGDHEQLPSVGAGLILRDLINSGQIPTTKLDEIFRQAQDSQIVINSHKIIKGIDTKNGLTIDNKNDFFFIKRNDTLKISKTILESLKRWLELGYDINDIQVLSPTKEGEIGTLNLNRKIQDLVNPRKRRKKEIEMSPLKTFREGDRIIHIKNNYDLNVMNGELGIIVEIKNQKKDEKRNIEEEIEITVDYNNKIVKYTPDEFDEIELSYAMTVHKSQGSEFPIVMMPIHSSHEFMNSRNLLYTGITRGKEKVVLIGETEALDKSINKIDNTERNSNIIKKLTKKITPAYNDHEEIKLKVG